jgi:hypothetical protein
MPECGGRLCSKQACKEFGVRSLSSTTHPSANREGFSGMTFQNRQCIDECEVKLAISMRFLEHVKPSCH